MNKYLQVFKISFAQEFAYRFNFIMWRVRNVLQIFLVFFLWSTIFSDPDKVIFGYNKDKILTYIFGIMIMKALVLSARVVDVSGEISRGDLTNYLLKPVNYFKYWLTRDISSKALNLGFAVFEFLLLYLVLKPSLFFQTDIIQLGGFLIITFLAIFLFFVLLFIISFVPFWAPELGWGVQFLVIIVATEFLSGGLFPLDILPSGIQGFLYLTPFPYLIFFPLQIFLGKVTGLALIKGILISSVWSIALFYLMKRLWYKGLLVYRAEGR
jgi:ABC-2 type transport system permease protein